MVCQLYLLKFPVTMRNAHAVAWELLAHVLRTRSIPMGEICHGPKGKPYLAGQPVHFNLSHTRGLCALALDEGCLLYTSRCV